jgi:hypothetical protein
MLIISGYGTAKTDANMYKTTISLGRYPFLTAYVPTPSASAVLLHTLTVGIFPSLGITRTLIPYNTNPAAEGSIKSSSLYLPRSE